MTLDELRAAVRASQIAEQATYVESLARPVVFLHPREESPGVGASKLGGTSLLPREGLLLLFAATEPDEAVFWQEPHYVRGMYIATPDGLVATPPPAPKLASETAWSLRFELGVHVPQSIDQRRDWPVQDPTDWRQCTAFHDVLQQIAGADEARDHLLGYPGVSSLAYDPTPGPDWLPLLTLASHDDLGWCWHDGDLLHVAIERDRLAAADFSVLSSDAG